MRRSFRTLLVIAGTLVPAIAASGDAVALVVLTTTTTEATTTTTESTTTTTTEATTTTTTEPPEEEPGGLSISVPAGAVLSPGVPVGAGALSAALGAVTVTDARGGLVTGWAATVAASDFVTGGGTPAETISSSDVAYWSGPATATSGIGPFVPGQLTAQLAAPLTSPAIAFTSLGPSGTSSATWVPTLVVTFPASAAVGQYVGTITHSVA